MATVYDVDANRLIDKASVKLKELVKAPGFTNYIKTGHSKERPPVERDWYYKRLASVLRTVYARGPIGTNRLRTKYGGRKNRGMAEERSYKGAGKVVRVALQELEKLGFIKQVEKGIHKGRIITPKGKSFLDKLAKE